jgi:hypothetical protein
MPFQYSFEDKKEIRLAIEDAYRDYTSLDIFTTERLGYRLASISSEKNITNSAFTLIEWAEARGLLQELLLNLKEDTQNPKIQEIGTRLLLEEERQENLDNSISSNTSSSSHTPRSYSSYVPTYYRFSTNLYLCTVAASLPIALIFAESGTELWVYGVIVAISIFDEEISFWKFLILNVAILLLSVWPTEKFLICLTFSLVLSLSYVIMMNWIRDELKYSANWFYLTLTLPGGVISSFLLGRWLIVQFPVLQPIQWIESAF